MKDLIWIIVLVIFCGSCNKEDNPTISDLRQHEIDKRVSQFIRNKQQECHEITMDRAVVVADSLLKLQAVKYVEDSLQRPPLPQKPQKKIKSAPKDSVRNRPFLQKDSIQ